MRSKATILTGDAGGIWSGAVEIDVPTQPREMSDEDFNITSYSYRYCYVWSPRGLAWFFYYIGSHSELKLARISIVEYSQRVIA